MKMEKLTIKKPKINLYTTDLVVYNLLKVWIKERVNQLINFIATEVSVTNGELSYIPYERVHDKFGHLFSSKSVFDQTLRILKQLQIIQSEKNRIQSRYKITHAFMPLLPHLNDLLIDSSVVSSQTSFLIFLTAVRHRNPFTLNYFYHELLPLSKSTLTRIFRNLSSTKVFHTQKNLKGKIIYEPTDKSFEIEQKLNELAQFIAKHNNFPVHELTRNYITLIPFYHFNTLLLLLMLFQPPQVHLLTKFAPTLFLPFSKLKELSIRLETSNLIVTRQEKRNKIYSQLTELGENTVKNFFKF